MAFPTSAGGYSRARLDRQVPWFGGAKWVKANSDIRLPFHSLRAHPGVFDRKGVVCVPNLVESLQVNATFCTKLPMDCDPSY
jgi:hypothetical protein